MWGGANGGWNPTDLAANGPAHEAGHLLGLEDHYIRNPETGVTKANWKYEDAIMGSASNNPRKDEFNMVLRQQIENHRFE